MSTVLWSKRFSISRGFYWKYERDCSEDNKDRWLEIFRKDEPLVEFKTSKNKPRVI